MTLPVRLLSAVALAFSAAAAVADNTSLDPAFATNGKFLVTYADYVRTLARLPRSDGGSVAVMNYRFAMSGNCVDGRDCLGLYTYTSAGGNAQPAINVPKQINFSTVRGATIDANDRSIVVGSVQISGGDHDYRVVRLLPNGQPDTSFGGDGIVDIALNLGGNNGDYANAVAVDPLGRIVVVGQVQRAAVGDTDFGIIRLTSSGALDTSFNSSGKFNVSFDLGAAVRLDAATSVVIGSDSRITVGGIALDNDLGVTRIALARLTATGDFDDTFCPTSCNFMSTYTNINNGRRVTYYGSTNPPHSDSLSAMSLNVAGELITAGTTPGAVDETLGFVQKFSNSGNYLTETSTQGGIVGGTRVYIGGVHSTFGGNIVLTGASGPNENFFFAQRFSSLLTPSTNWGFAGLDNSVYLWSAAATFGDVGQNRPGSSAIDLNGRILTGGSFKVSSTADPYSAVVSRLTYTGSFVDAVFKSSFE